MRTLRKRFGYRYDALRIEPEFFNYLNKLDKQYDGRVVINIEENPIKKRIDELGAVINKEVEESKDYYKFLKVVHGGARFGFISTQWMHNGKVYRWGIPVDKIEYLGLFTNQSDFYYSVNTFSVPKHKQGEADSKNWGTENVKNLNALFVDLDYYNVPELSNFSAEELIAYLESHKIGGDTQIPYPTFYVDSGRGLCLIWCLSYTVAENKNSKTNTMTFWRDVQQKLVRYFKDCGADLKVKDPTRIFRVIGTRNSKSKSKVRILRSPNEERVSNFDSPLKYRIGDINQALKKHIPFKVLTGGNKGRKVGKKSRRCANLNQWTNINLKRAKDLEILVSLREGTANKIKWRNQLLFHYWLNLLYGGISMEDSMNMTLDLNRKLDIPLEEKEIKDKWHSMKKVSDAYFKEVEKNGAAIFYIRNQNNGVYRYKNETVIDELIITEEEQEHLTCFVSNNIKSDRKRVHAHLHYIKNKDKVLEDKKAYYEKNKEEILAKRKQKRKEAKDEKNKKMYAKIQELLDKNMTQKAIADELGCSLSTVKKKIKDMKENTIMDVCIEDGKEKGKLVKVENIECMPFVVDTVCEYKIKSMPFMEIKFIIPIEDTG